MANREERVRWSIEHRTAVFWVERATAFVALLVGAWMAYYGSGVGSYAGTGIASVGAFMAFPSIRPLFSKVVDRLPFLSPAMRTKPPELEE